MANVLEKHSASFFGTEVALKMQTLFFSETWASTYDKTQHKNTEEHHHNPCCLENLRCCLDPSGCSKGPGLL
jgi:hypothetical protein